jgi:hypothetical protein
MEQDWAMYSGDYGLREREMTQGQQNWQDEFDLMMQQWQAQQDGGYY